MSRHTQSHLSRQDPDLSSPGRPGRRGAVPGRQGRGRGTSHAGRPEPTAQV